MRILILLASGVMAGCSIPHENEMSTTATPADAKEHSSNALNLTKEQLLSIVDNAPKLDTPQLMKHPQR